MIQKFNNVNPNKLHDELKAKDIVPIFVESDIKIGEYIAENVWITFADDVDIAKVNQVVSKHNPTPVIYPTLEETLRAKILKDNADMQLQLTAQQKLNADILLKIAKLGGTTNV